MNHGTIETNISVYNESGMSYCPDSVVRCEWIRINTQSISYEVFWDTVSVDKGEAADFTELWLTLIKCSRWVLK